MCPVTDSQPSLQIGLIPVNPHSMSKGDCHGLWLNRNTNTIFGYKTGFTFSRVTTDNSISPINFAVLRVLPFLNRSKDLDPSFKMDLDFWDCF